MSGALTPLTPTTPTPHEPARLAVLLSGSGRTLENLLAAIARGELNARVTVVVASKACLGAEKARAAGLPTLIATGSIPGPDLGRILAEHQAQWVILAGYLKLVNIPEGFEGRVVNIHPALLPAFGGPGMHGKKVHEAVIAAARAGQVAESGCTVHLCDSRYDTGPIVLQRSCPVLPADTPETLAERVFAEECLAYPEALRRLFSGSAQPSRRTTA